MCKVVIGGSVIDCCATLKGNELTLDGRIYDAKFKLNAGGVARNMTEAMGKLGLAPIFISVIGNDNYGDYLCSVLPSKSTQNVYKLTDSSTAQCTVIFDNRGDCKILIGDMDVHQRITAEMVYNHEELIRKSPLLVLDGNLSVSALEAALELADKHSVPVFFEPTDVPVANKPFKTARWKSIKYITPNTTELKQIAKVLDLSLPSSTYVDVVEEAALISKMMVDHIPNVIVTLGSNGVVVARKASASEPLMNSTCTNETSVRHYPIEKVNDLVNVSGAGDCLASGLIIAMLRGLSEERCVKVGYAAARASLFAECAVPEVLFDNTHPAWFEKAKYCTLF